ncbi:hypothetical protein LPW26_19100 [Rhodopseudomonas sp. HC1]|uniref:hypothetical protein n=1 Tax=Rhodopseudomonas infernalis TaxID=2897386 RepID=UPI001EE9A57F|nr:hypothetical protein [Rhodopseudomonas infernalis]MCG6206761.1 hypothetical protein [Rhodopseudomonas infernalis]
MPKRLTAEDLIAMSPNKRAILYENARRKFENGGKEIIELIDSLGLSLSSGQMKSDDPTFTKMEEIIWSKEGKEAALIATAKGLPALAGTEPLLVAALGERYMPHDGGTLNAGFVQAAVMRHLGFTDDKEGRMPVGSVAKTAMRWKKTTT